MSNYMSKKIINMKKLFKVLAATIICGATTFTSCTNDDNPATPDLGVKEKIIGKWIVADKNGKPLSSNEKTVYTFVSATKATVSTSINTHPEVGTHWNDRLDADVTIDDNKISLTDHPDETTTVVEEYIVTDISGTEFTANHKVVVTKDGIVVDNDNHVLRLVKTIDYRDAIVGTWEGRCTSEGSVFDDGQEHRWEYKADGTYVYYVKDGNNWVPYATNTLNEYFVDGNLLCTRWIDNGVENREWWEITIAADHMNWTALRENEDGTTFTATFEMEKVE